MINMRAYKNEYKNVPENKVIISTHIILVQNLYLFII